MISPKKILFACVPADGHFSPLTGLAAHLKKAGHDVRWYTSATYKEKIEKLGVTHYPLKKALDISAGKIEEVFPERSKHKSQISKLKYDFKHAFILRGPEYFEDIQDIHKEFPFDVMIADIAFTALPFVKHKLKKPVISIGVTPLGETSRDLAPNGLGITPSHSLWGRRKQDILRLFADAVLFGESKKLATRVFGEYGIKLPEGNVFDVLYRESNLILQSGTPKFEYYRSDLNKNIRFIGPLLPYSQRKTQRFELEEKHKKYKKVILVTQGTVEKEPEKIIIPTLEAFKDSQYLVVATTGGSQTQELRARYPQHNIIIEDFLPFTDIMPLCDVYVTNGGYGGVMLAIENKLPLVVAGIHEGKNEINARIGYFELGINLNTEKPAPAQLKMAVEQVLANNMYKKNVEKLSKEFATYNPQELCEQYIYEVLQDADSLKEMKKKHTVEEI
jgi:MGT family glycosyltransferase